VSTSNDPSGRPRVIDLINTKNRVYNVGRLDQSSEGLILVTNDGDLANRLTHPRYGIEKTYHVQVDGRPSQETLRQLQDGVYIAEGRVRASHIRFLKKNTNGAMLEIVLDEGRNREIRRMLAAVGHKVRVLKRVSIGPLKLADLPRGAHRPLTTQEIKTLKRATENVVKKKKPVKRGKAKTAVELREALGGSKKAGSKKPIKKKTSTRSAATGRGAKSKSPKAGTSGMGRRVSRTAKAPRRPRRK
jgi:23S rRNA pseudouridine2605 synthase